MAQPAQNKATPGARDGLAKGRSAETVGDLSFWSTAENLATPRHICLRLLYSHYARFTLPFRLLFVESLDWCGVLPANVKVNPVVKGGENVDSSNIML
jgi:hypothetical protein